MANLASPLIYLSKRESGCINNLKKHLFDSRLQVAKNLFKRDLICHYGCVNAIEFSNNGELLASGGDDRRVMLWKFGHTILERGKPEQMKAQHMSNIFCLGITSDNRKIYSGGNDDQVIVHDIEKKCPLEVLPHQRAICGLGIDPYNELVLATAGNDGRLLLFDTRLSVHEQLVISRSRKAFHAVMFHPTQIGILVSANARDGVALWDLRTVKHPVLRYQGNSGTCQNSMSVRFNACGTRILALRRRLPPALYNLNAPDPLAEFYHQDYYNSCTMKSCCFAGEDDQYALSGSDDFNLYMWRIPDEGGGYDKVVEPPHVILYGHRSIVNQVRYNRRLCALASSGVEKVVKLWAGVRYPGMQGDLLDGAAGAETRREIYSHGDYVSLVHHGQYISHNYAEQSTSEDPRMMAFFDTLVQRELEGLGGESDSQSGSDSRSRSGAGSPRSKDEDSSDGRHADFLPLSHKRPGGGGRSGRCSARISRLLALRATRNAKSSRSHKRGSLRRAKNSTRSKGSAAASTVKGCRGSVRASRRHAGASAVRCHAPPPSSERTDSDDTPSGPARTVYRNTGKIIRPLRRRMNLSRAVKRKTKSANYRKVDVRNNGGTVTTDDLDDSNFNRDSTDDNLALPSTSTGYRGQNSSALFRIAEVDSDDDQSASSRPISPTHNGHSTPHNLVSIVPTPINGSRDSLGDSLIVEPPNSSNNSSPIETRSRLQRRRRNGRMSYRSDSSESSPPRNGAKTPMPESPKSGYSQTINRLMNETNESELESSCSDGFTAWGRLGVTPDSGVCTAGGSSSRRHQEEENSDDPDLVAMKFRQRVKKARRNYRNHIGDSDSN